MFCVLTETEEDVMVFSRSISWVSPFCRSPQRSGFFIKHTHQNGVLVPTLESLAHFLLIYLLFGVPAVLYAFITVVEIRRDKGAFRRCDHCGHTGRMTSILQNNEICYAAGLLLLSGIIPGLIFLKWASRRYPCKVCGTISRHLSSSESLSEY